MHTRLKLLRESLGFRQGKFAEKLGIAQTYLSEIEKGRKGLPATLFLALDSLNIDLHWLITGDGNMFRNDSCQIQYQNDSANDLIKIIQNLPPKRREKVFLYAEDQRDLSKLLGEKVG